jgi:hypothetical protein
MNIVNNKQSVKKRRQLTVREKADHAISVHDYPDFDLDENEYVLIDVDRTKLIPFLAHGAAILIYIIFTAIAFLDMHGFIEIGNTGLFSLACLLVTIILAAICYGVVWVYHRNQIVVSNMRIFCKIQSSLFAYRMQSIELENIEDVSYSQNGILANVLGYGSIRFSTIGNENTYELTFVSDPKNQIKIIKNAVHDINNGGVGKHNNKDGEA